MGKGEGHEIVLSLILSGLLSSRRIIRLLRSLSAEEVAEATPRSMGTRLGLRPEDIARIAESRDEVSRLDAWLRRSGVRIITLCDPDYPHMLREIPSPPPILFFRGDLAAAGLKTVAIVGSRKASLAGLKIATSLAKDLARLGFTIVSGLARGIDRAAHTGALEAGGATIAVLGSGIDVIYPPEHDKLARSISNSGAVMTELPPGTPPLRQNFPRRNRIISGLSVGTVVVEAGEASGALITAHCALEQNRSVFAVPSTPGYATSVGTNRLLKEGAALVESADDILREICPQIGSPAPAVRNLFSSLDLTSEESKVMALLSSAPTHVDEISRGLDLESHQALNVLLALETRGLVRSMPGKFYVKETPL